MLYRTRHYEVTSGFIGLIWQGGVTVIGVDLSAWAWGVVLGRWYIGWYAEKETR